MSSNAPKRAKTRGTVRSSRLLERQLVASARLKLWLDWQVPSENQIRYKHWSNARRIKEGAKLAWLSALKSSASECGNLMRIISSLAPNPSEMLLREASVLTTLTSAFAGESPRSLPSAQPAPLSVSKESNET